MPTEQMMSLLPWKRKKMGADLSAYIDGELDAYRAAELSEDLVFDPRLQNKIYRLEQISALAGASLEPGPLPDPKTAADQILQAVEPALAPPLAAPQTRKRLKPALIASVGLLLTAGITFAGLRRRGLV